MSSAENFTQSASVKMMCHAEESKLDFLPFFSLGDNFCDFLFAFIHNKPLLVAFIYNKPLLNRCLRGAFFPFRVDAFSEGKQNNFIRVAGSVLTLTLPQAIISLLQTA